MTETPLELGPGDHTRCIAAIEALTARVSDLERKLLAALAEISDLKARLGQNSRNSSRPSSTDGPGVEHPPKTPRSGRKPGGQPGHEAHLRKRVPRERVNKLVVLVPDECKGCGGPLESLDDFPDWHQLFELPEIAPHITEFELRAGWCSCCKRRTRAELPSDVPRSAFGPRLQVLVAILTGRFRMSKREVVSLLSEVFHIEMSEGSITACERASSDSVAGPVEEATAYVREQPVIYADETGWRERLEKAWLWVAVTANVTVFLIHRHRGTEAARALLGAFRGVLVSDRWCAYNDWWVARRQLCWAHLIRHFVAMSELSGTTAKIGAELLNEAERLFHWWHRLKAGCMTRSTFKRHVPRLRERVGELLRRGTTCGHEKTEGQCAEILKLFPAMWTFAYEAGVEPTNNTAEQAIRPGVLWRKGSFGTHSAEGSRFAARMMTVAATLKQQGRNLFDFLFACREAALHGRRPPSLLPQDQAVLTSASA